VLVEVAAVEMTLPQVVLEVLEAQPEAEAEAVEVEQTSVEPLEPVELENVEFGLFKRRIKYEHISIIKN